MGCRAADLVKSREWPFVRRLAHDEAINHSGDHQDQYSQSQGFMYEEQRTFQRTVSVKIIGPDTEGDCGENYCGHQPVEGALDSIIVKSCCHSRSHPSAIA